MNTSVRVATDATSRRRVDEQCRSYSRRLLDALRVADPAAAQGVIDSALGERLSPESIQSRVITPAMYRVGELWAERVLTVADEHLATAICHRVLASLYRALEREPVPPRARVLLAAVHGQHHAMGLRMVADVLEGAGHDVLHLGADVPIDDLEQAVERHEPDILGLTLTMPLGAPVLMESLFRVQRVNPDLMAVLGGQGVPRRLKDAGWPFVPSSEDVLLTVSRLMQARPSMPRAVRPLHLGLTTPVTTEAARGIGTAEDRLAQLVAEAADLARTETRRARALYESAYRDAVTRLPNRRALDERLEEGVSSTEALLLIDVDRFKQVNDTHGHEVGDRVLRRVADVMRARLRLGDFAARFGGDEFAVVAGDGAEATIVAERLRSAVEESLADFDVTLSIGIARGGDGAVLRRADVALYAAKKAGRNCVRDEEVS
jgi:diguanylate cyclase (GGDEF)-like protein